MNAMHFTKGKFCCADFVLLAVLLGLIGSAFAGAPPVPERKIVVFTTIFPEEMPFFSKMSGIYSEAFKRMGYGFKLISQPGERAMIDADQGIADGEAGRIMNIDREKYPNLIRVPCPIAIMQDGAYALDESIRIDGWQSLAGKPYVVGLIKGIKSVEEKLPLYVDENHIITLEKLDQGLAMLRTKRIDLLIISTLIEDSDCFKKKINEKIKCVGIVETKTLYPWLNKKNADLVVPLMEMLKIMKI